jgi:hypothetical protein
MWREAFNGVRNQMGPCGIACATCEGGNGAIGEAAYRLQEVLKRSGIASVAHMLPGGSEIDFDRLDKALTWMQTSINCPGCEQGGGPPDCAIRLCAKGKGYQLCSECPDLEGCDKFNFLGTPERLKKTLRESKGKSKQELIEEVLAKTKRP